MLDKEFYYTEYPWSIIKSFILSFDKTRSTKTAKLIKPFCDKYRSLLEDDIILPDTEFTFVYFYSMMTYHYPNPNFNYLLFPRNVQRSI